MHAPMISHLYVGSPIGPSAQPINFTDVNASALRLLPALLSRWLPEGRTVGDEYVARNPKRNDRSPGSFKVRLRGARAGAWADFATGETGGDVISLAAFLAGVSQSEAARRLAKMLGGHNDR
ncbi:hypothetical protein V5F77_19515 [Xanthobacter sp. DSM 24535]|uniref:hypothetical protein n=1 Tax=Roseixanthobacter psychrophilus TaxID=3119917 RepID=UPI0037270EF1